MIVVEARDNAIGPMTDVQRRCQYFHTVDTSLITNSEPKKIYYRQLKVIKLYFFYESTKTI